MIDRINNFLEPQVAEFIDTQLRQILWQYEHKSKTSKVNKHWHHHCGENESDLHDRYDILPIWQNISNKFPEYKLKRAYLNAHTHGMEPQIHRDDGDMTFIYYPRMDWKISWGGGTTVFDDYGYDIKKNFSYKGNRLIMFPANLPHQAQPVSRECYELRTCVVFKTSRI